MAILSELAVTTDSHHHHHIIIIRHQNTMKTIMVAIDEDGMSVSGLDMALPSRCFGGLGWRRLVQLLQRGRIESQ